MSDYIIHGSTLTGIADAVRGMRHETDGMTPAQIEQKIKDTRLGLPIDVSVHIDDETGRWVRPSDWPDLDAIEIGDDAEVLYLTYDLRKTPGYGWIGIYVNLESSGTYYLERGHIADGVFVVDETHSAARQAVYRQALNSTDGDVQLWRIRADKHITYFGFATDTASTTQADNYPNWMQPCVERVGRLPYLTGGAFRNYSSEYRKPTDYYYCTCWMERDKVLEAGSQGNITYLSYTWANAYSLQELDVSTWDTSGWTVSSMSNSWRSCHSLRSLDLSGWNTSNWAVTSMESCWYRCDSMTTLNISGWDTSGWPQKSLNTTWLGCRSLRSLDLSGWDTSNWPFTTIGGAWSYCYALEYLNVKGWDTSGWAISNLASVWSECRSLRELDLSDWDVSNWSVTTLNQTWGNCHALQKLDISGWDTTNWAVTTLNTTWGACYSLRELDLSGWNVSNWRVTTLSQTWYNCYSLKTLNVSGWDVSDWQVTTIYYMFAYTRSLRVIDLSGWDTTAWPLTTINYWIRELFLTEEIYVPSVMFNGRDGGTANVTDNNLYRLQKTSGFDFSISHNYSNSSMLTPAALVNILNRLPTVTGTKTITLGQDNKKKLSAQQIAIATQKGWTVA